MYRSNPSKVDTLKRVDRHARTTGGRDMADSLQRAGVRAGAGHKKKTNAWAITQDAGVADVCMCVCDVCMCMWAYMHAWC